MSENFKERLSGFILLERAISARLEILLANGSITFDANESWRDQETNAIIARQHEDGSFFTPDFFIAEPISFTYNGKEYRIFNQAS